MYVQFILCCTYIFQYFYVFFATGDFFLWLFRVMALPRAGLPLVFADRRAPCAFLVIFSLKTDKNPILRLYEIGFIYLKLRVERKKEMSVIFRLFINIIKFCKGGDNICYSIYSLLQSLFLNVNIQKLRLTKPIILIS